MCWPFLMLIPHGEYLLRIVNDPNYTLRSVDNLRNYERVSCLGEGGSYLSSGHAVVVERDEEEIASHLLVADGGASGVHPHCALVHNRRVYLAVGRWICALEIPTLELVWKTQVDWATCFGVYISEKHECLISHGELQIARLEWDGEIRWQSSGADIFTGAFSLRADEVEAEDFYGQRYRFSIQNGQLI